MGLLEEEIPNLNPIIVSSMFLMLKLETIIFRFHVCFSESAFFHIARFSDMLKN